MYEGEIVDILPAEQPTKEELGLLMCGWEDEEAADASVA
jgi:hypothetical protein